MGREEVSTVAGTKPTIGTLCAEVVAFLFEMRAAIIVSSETGDKGVGEVGGEDVEFKRLFVERLSENGGSQVGT